MTRFLGVLATTVGTLLSIVAVSLELVLLFALHSPALSAAAVATDDACRLVVGRQFAAGLPTYVLGLLLSGYLFVDNTLLFVVDVTFGLRKKELRETAPGVALKKPEDELSNWEKAIKAIEETTEAVRWTRFLMTGVLLVLLCVSRVAVLLPPYMTEPGCPAVDASIMTLGLVNLVLMILIIVGVPLVRAGIEHRWIDDYVERKDKPDPTVPIPGSKLAPLWIGLTAAGLLLSLGAQWVLCIALGNGWGASIADPGSSTTTTQEWTDAWLNKTTTIAVVALLSGILLPLSVGRWMFSMVSMLNVILLSVWAGLMLVGLVALWLVEGGDPSLEAATAICSSTKLDRMICEVRFGVHLAGIGLVAVGFLASLFICALRNFRVILGINKPEASADTAGIPGKEQYPLLVMSAQR